MARGDGADRELIAQRVSPFAQFGAIAQVVEHCLCKAGVRGSNPRGSTHAHTHTHTTNPTQTG